MLEAAAWGKAEPRHLRNNGGETAIAECILGDGEHGAIIAGLRIDYPIGMQPNASQGRGEEVAPCEAPQHRPAQARQHAGREQSSGGAVR